MKFVFHGHACFELVTDKESLLFDPFLTDNPQADVYAEDVHCDYILVSHAHEDHFADAHIIAIRTGAKVIGVPEILNLLSVPPAKITNVHALNLGGSFVFPFGRVTMVPALHSSGAPGGSSCGYVVEFNEGPCVYYSGDTAFFSDMALFGEKFDIDYAILPIGDNYTMGPKMAIRAAKLLKAKHVIPVHYNTWPVIKQDPESFRKLAEAEGLNVQIVKPGTSIELE
jgi:L-ascorbate metabolism protein UlaG (beta-lactamase superfamily)